jgi:glycosyltransferase involved in cell wall biosynthesis
MQRVAVIVPLYNRARFIGSALDSLIEQSDACDLSIIVVDDGSTDESPEIVHQYMLRHSMIKMVSTRNQGVTKARNVGLSCIPEDAGFVTFLDSDDISPPGRFAKDLQVFEDQPEIQFTYGLITLSELLDEQGEPDPHAKQVTVRGISLTAGIYRKALIDRIGRFDESLVQSEDTDYLLRIFETSSQFVQTETICVYYRRHDGNMTRDVFTARRGIMLAMKKAADRRKANPAIVMPRDVFDFTNMIGIKIA